MRITLRGQIVLAVVGVAALYSFVRGLIAIGVLLAQYR